MYSDWRCAYRRGDDVIVAVLVGGARAEVELPAGRWRSVVDEPYAAVFERA